MRLTNYMRQAFVRSVMQEIPKPDYESLKKQCQDALYAAMSADVRRVYRKSPKALVTVSSWDFDDRYSHRFVVGDADFDKVAEPFLEQCKARERFRKKLENTVNGFTTVKQLRDAFPELAHHLPDEKKPTVNLPAVANLVADMVQLGWKGKEAQAA